MTRQRVIATGRVQGVGFRESARWRATSAGISGFARNLADGRFEATFEGETEAVSELVEWCATGPPAARVQAVTVEEEPPRGETGFEVR
ncbi:MAG: acylphosphatase [Acidimicrobiales bacterium]